MDIPGLGLRNTLANSQGKDPIERTSCAVCSETAMSRSMYIDPRETETVRIHQPIIMVSRRSGVPTSPGYGSQLASLLNPTL